jgi:hypothetical protein
MIAPSYPIESFWFGEIRFVRIMYVCTEYVGSDLLSTDSGGVLIVDWFN